MVNAFSCALVDGVLAALENTTALSIFITIIYFLNNPLWSLTFSGVHIIIYHLPIFSIRSGGQYHLEERGERYQSMYSSKQNGENMASPHYEQLKVRKHF